MMGFCEQHGFAVPCPRCTKNSRKASVELARLRAKNERLRAALVDAQGYGEMLERVLLPFSNFAVAFLNNVSDGHWPEASGSTTRWQGMTAGTEITFGDLANAAAALKAEP